MCRLLHKVFEVVVDLDESMAGLHFFCMNAGAALRERQKQY